MPLWSDGADKARAILAEAPLGATDDAWDVPTGTYLVKTFAFAGRRVETRVIALLDSGPAFATYVWNAAQTEAFASGGNLDVEVGDRVLHVPGTSQCTARHAAGALGIRPPQLAAQLDALIAAGVVDQRPGFVDPFVDPFGEAGLTARAASYLDANCAHCHRPGGTAAGTHADWRREHLRGNICRSANRRPSYSSARSSVSASQCGDASRHSAR